MLWTISTDPSRQHNIILWLPLSPEQRHLIIKKGCRPTSKSKNQIAALSWVMVFSRSLDGFFLAGFQLSGLESLLALEQVNHVGARFRRFRRWFRRWFRGWFQGCLVPCRRIGREDKEAQAILLKLKSAEPRAFPGSMGFFFSLPRQSYLWTCRTSPPSAGKTSTFFPRWSVCGLNLQQTNLIVKQTILNFFKVTF